MFFRVRPGAHQIGDALAEALEPKVQGTDAPIADFKTFFGGLVRACFLPVMSLRSSVSLCVLCQCAVPEASLQADCFGGPCAASGVERVARRRPNGCPWPWSNLPPIAVA